MKLRLRMDKTYHGLHLGLEANKMQWTSRRGVEVAFYLLDRALIVELEK